jgi:ribosome-binding factor A
MSHRIERVNTLIRRELSDIIHNQLRDPRLDVFITINEVETSVDLKFAKIFVSSIGGKQEEAKVLGVLKAAAGFLRTELAQKVRLKHTPELNFIWDDSIEHGDRILRLIDQVSTEYET